MAIEDDALFQHAETVLAETARLRAAHERFREQVERRLEQMRQVEAELDPLLSHPPAEMRAIWRLHTGEAS
ncbi:hypothetical protein [Microvirga massiliensis]|uniref:hypothetical protein n=1 Tax=Microvirga massiliensis TaxID=1033741 RepID=UPI00062B45F0|nr:hypothetical protein [Microvirga massiliensis]